MIFIKKSKIVNRRGEKPLSEYYNLYIIGKASSQEIDEIIREKKLRIVRIDDCKLFDVNKIILAEKL